MDNNHRWCLVCNSLNIHTLKGYEENHLAVCDSCGLVFCSKIPSANELKKHYENYPAPSSIPEFVVKRYHQLLDEFEKYRSTNNLLDLGCGNGYFLEEAKKRGWNTYGTEFSEKAKQICLQKKISMHFGSLNNHTFDNISFDVITMFEVIEHLSNPKEELKKIHSLLRPMGILYITTPNFQSLSRWLLKNKWSVIDYPDHLYYFTHTSLHKLLTSHGFKKISMKSTGLDLTRKRENTQPISHSFTDIFRKADENKFLLVIKSLINYMLTIFKKGDTLKAFYQKNPTHSSHLKKNLIPLFTLLYSYV